MSLNSGTDIKKRVECFNKVLVDAAYKHVGKTKPRRGGKSYLTPSVKTAITKRNRLRKAVHERKEEWVEACKEVREAIKNAQEDSWRDLLTSATNEDEGKLWRVIKSLKGSPDSNSPNEAMIHKGKTVVSSRCKADIFISHYASGQPSQVYQGRQSNK